MRKSEINWLSIISLAVTVLLSIFKDETNYVVIYPIIGVIAVVLIVNIVLKKTKANKNLSNTAVIAKSKKYTNYLWKLVKVNEKKMAKFKRTSDIKKIEKNNKMILDLMKGKNNLAKKEKLAVLIEEINNFFTSIQLSRTSLLS